MVYVSKVGILEKSGKSKVFPSCLTLSCDCGSLDKIGHMGDVPWGYIYIQLSIEFVHCMYEHLHGFRMAAITTVTTSMNSTWVGGCPGTKLWLISCCNCDIFAFILDLYTIRVWMQCSNCAYKVLLNSTVLFAGTQLFREFGEYEDVQMSILLPRRSQR